MLELFEHLLGFAAFAAVRGDDQGAVVLFFRLGFISFARGLDDGGRRAFDLVSDLHIAEPQLRQTILNEPLLLNGEIALGFLLEHSQHVDGMTGYGQIGFGLLLFAAKVKQPKLDLRLHENGFHQEREACGGKWEILRGFSAICHTTSLSYLQSYAAAPREFIDREWQRSHRQQREREPSIGHLGGTPRVNLPLAREPG